MPFDPNRLWGYDLIRAELLAGKRGEALFKANRRLGLLPYALGLAWDSIESFSTIAHEYARLVASVATTYVDPSRLSVAIVPTPEEVLKRLEAAYRQDG